jgi:hypothetical protein
MASSNSKTDLESAGPIPSLRHIERFKTNPLIAIQQVKINVRKRVATGLDVNDMGSETTVVTDEYVDAATFVKVFDAGIKASYDLSNAAFKVYQLVLQVTGRGKRDADEITLHPVMVEDAPVKMSVDTYWRGLRELVSKRFIAASLIPHRYWLNPHFFVKGDTFKIVRRYQIAEKAKTRVATTKLTPLQEPDMPPNLFESVVSGSD